MPSDGVTMGEVMLRGKTIIRGIPHERAKREAFPAVDHTGDLAVGSTVHRDQYRRGHHHLRGRNSRSWRSRNAFRSAGDEAAVVARPDAKWGETPCAFVVLKPDATPTSAADILAWCRTHLAAFKVPKTVVFGELPKTSTGKIQKFVLRERARGL